MIYAIVWVLVGVVVSSIFAMTQINIVRKMVEHGVSQMSSEELAEYNAADKSPGYALDRRLFLTAVIVSPILWPYHLYMLLTVKRSSAERTIEDMFREGK